MPFGRDDNGLALDAISLNIELSIREMSGEALEIASRCSQWGMCCTECLPHGQRRLRRELGLASFWSLTLIFGTDRESHISTRGE